MFRSLNEIIDQAMQNAFPILEEMSKKRIKYNKRVANRQKLRRK